MSVITISRESGSEGRYIAETVAKTLGYHFADKKTIGKLLEQYGFIEFGEKYDAAIGFWGRYDNQMTEMVSMLNQVSMALANHGNTVILGRGCFAVLQGYVDVLNIRIQAPFRLRVERILREQKEPNTQAAELSVQASDRARKGFVESFYGVRWDSSSPFDLVIDTGKIGRDAAVSWIVDAAKGIPSRITDQDRTARGISADSTLVAAVNEVLACPGLHA
jgi:cytidylate kinase